MSEKYDPELGAVMKAHHAPAERVDRVPVKEIFRGETVWEGVVNVYDVKGHSKVKQAYAWSYKDDKGEAQYVVVSKIPPVVDPITAVRASIMAARKPDRV
ncbi:MAG TPA: hypothetical protein VG838_14980 [Opitutaceae bacterium]|nr:hypothetical protein [Opitutaceae bacterium]